MGVTETESLEEPGAAPVGEAFITGEQDLADLVERASLAASMPELLLLDSAADGVLRCGNSASEAAPLCIERSLRCGRDLVGSGG